MCRNIKTLFNFDPPATDEEIHAASLQFVRKLSGYTNTADHSSVIPKRVHRKALKPCRSPVCASAGL